MCARDCDNDDAVTVDELLIGINIILMQEGLNTCRRFDLDRDSLVTIDELVRAIQSVLNGC